MIRAIVNKLKKNEKGFSLIELMVVVAIIGILAAGILPQFMKASDKAKEGRAQADMANFKTLLELVYADDGIYPDKLDALVTKGYMKSVPENPWENNYAYTQDNGGASYTLNEGPHTKK